MAAEQAAAGAASLTDTAEGKAVRSLVVGLRPCCTESFRISRLLSRASMLMHGLLLYLQRLSALVVSRKGWAAFALPRRLHARTTMLCAKLAAAS